MKKYERTMGKITTAVSFARSPRNVKAKNPHMFLFKTAKNAKRMKNVNSTSPMLAIYATDSTFAGCTAKNNAARNATALDENTFSTRKNKRITLKRWNAI